MFTSHRRYTEEDEAENDRAAVSGALWVNDLYISISQIASLGGSGSNPGDEMTQVSQMQGALPKDTPHRQAPTPPPLAGPPCRSVGLST